MARIVPTQRPEFTSAFAEELITANGLKLDKPILLGRRSYYRDSMGAPGKNDRGIYDDAIALVSPDVFLTFNANTDPSIKRPHIAVLKAGVWTYKIGIHNISKDPDEHPHYTALVQAAPVTVARDGADDDTGWFGINIHAGSYTTTSSAGCQTIYPEQWMEFIGSVQKEMAAHHLETISYVLTERADT